MSKVKNKEAWRSNLIILWFGTFMTGVGLSLIAPFLSLYVDTLGHYSTSALNTWSGVIFAITFVTNAITAPFWGKLADEKGRKIMLLRAAFMMGLCIFLMGLVQSAWQLLALRALLGAFSGFTSNSIALMAISAPKDKSGQVLSTLTTGSVSGTLLGPIIGGAIVDLVGFRYVFFITGIIMFIVFFLALFFVKETFVKSEKTKSLNFKEVRSLITNPLLIISMLLTTLIVQITNQSINPLLSLYVRELMHNHSNLALFSGLVASAPGITTLAAAPFFGRLGDKVGQKRILSIGLVVSLVWFVLMGSVANVYQLIMIRLLVGISDAMILPQVQALLAKNTPYQITSRIFSYNQSFQSSGAFIGPIVGSFVANIFHDYRFVFYSSALFIIVNIVNNQLFVNRKEKEITN
ncbi:MAG: MFS transporter [Bacilli bacterium]|nr:MFS transporter [Bacilli bacterium]